MSCSVLEIKSPIVVEANIKRWTICSDDIYLLKFYEAPPQWLEDIIWDVVDDSGLADDVSDLEDRFTNFEEGYVEHFYDWKDGDTDTLAYVQNIYTSKAQYNAGIQEIKVAYVSKDESGAFFDFYMGAWQTGAGGAWFNEQVSVVSNVAYSAAKSASTLTASLASQQDQLSIIVGDIEALEKQVDGKVETWIGEHDVVTPQGVLIEDAKPYWCWSPGNDCSGDPEYPGDTTEDTRLEHTGDTYVKTEKDVYGNDQLVGMWAFTVDAVTGEFQWNVITNTLAAEAYQAALDAGVLADGKINSYYQTYPPTSIEDPTLGDGDIWLDSDDDNKMYRYDDTLGWLQVRDTAIQASVDRLDEATVDINGVATAKSSLVVNADGNISGYVASASTDPNYTGSDFRIFADNFYLANTEGQPANTVPFRVDTVANDIFFNGYVNFENILDDGSPPDWVFKSTLETDIDRDVTTINGGKITTGYIDAKYLGVDTIWTRGMIVSADYSGSSSGYIGSANPTGFMLNATAGAGSYNEPNIYGSYIRGGSMYATHLQAVRIDAAEIYGSYIYGSTIETGNLIAPSINGMSFKMGTIVSTIDELQYFDIDANEGVMRDKFGNKIQRRQQTDRFSNLLGVYLSIVGPGTETKGVSLPIVQDYKTFAWHRHDDYNGVLVLSFLAWGY